KGASIQPNEVRFFRKTFRAANIPTKATLSLAVDDEATVYINGAEVARPKGFSKPTNEDVTDYINKGENVIAIRAQNTGSDVAGVLVMMELKSARRGADFIVTDDTWLTSDKADLDWQQIKFNDSSWSKAQVKGKLGDQP